MAISKERKDKLMVQYVELLNESQAIFLTEYKGLNVKIMEALRKEVRDADGRFHVTKNTILYYALEQCDKPLPKDLLLNQSATGFAMGEAPALAKALVDFAKKEESFVVKGGILGNNILTAEQVADLAKLPSLDQLRGQILGLITAPARNIAATVASSVRQVVNVIDAYAKQEEEATE